MRKLTFAALLGLAACAAAPDGGGTALRVPSAPIYSAAAFDTTRLAGRWAQVAGFGAACAPGVVEFTPTPQGLTLRGSLCLDGRQVRLSGPVAPLGQGRFAVPGMADWWVLWVDSGYRTLAIGTPSGAFGFVLDRGAIPRDRLDAARELFDFNGYSAPGLTAY